MASENLGSVVGRRGAGISTIGGGDPAMHSLGHYGKQPPPDLLGEIPGLGVGLGGGSGGMVMGGIGRHPRRGGLGLSRNS